MSEVQMEIDWGHVPTEMESGFLDFHAENPQVLAEIIARVEVMRARGRKIGIGMIFEVLRWNFYVSTETQEPFKLNNNYRAFYTRLVEETRPDLVGVLTKRKSIADY